MHKRSSHFVLPRTLRALLALSLAAATLGCASGGQRSLGMIAGPINDPSNRSLRREILAYGLDEFCHQMTTHTAPLALADDAPAVGRFFPQRCAKQELEDGNLFVRFGGVGYAYTNVTKKMSFSVEGAIEYNQDFKMVGSTMYAYFRTKRVQSSQFSVRAIEQPVASLFHQANPIADSIGRQLVVEKMRGGFTVIREPNGSADFGLGLIAVGKRPPHPFDVTGDDRLTIENARVEVYPEQRDFAGPVEIDDDDRALFLTVRVDGASTVDVLVLRKDVAEMSLGAYVQNALVTPLSGPPVFDDVVQAGVEYRRTLPLPKGLYYVVFDHSRSAGRSAPTSASAAVVSYALQVGDVP